MVKKSHKIERSDELKGITHKTRRTEVKEADMHKFIS